MRRRPGGEATDLGVEVGGGHEDALRDVPEHGGGRATARRWQDPAPPQDGWLLDAGDAYFDDREVKAPQRSCGPGPAIFQTVITMDRPARHANQDRLRTLHVDHPEVRMFAAHNPFEYLELAGTQGFEPRGITAHRGLRRDRGRLVEHP